MPRPMIKNSPFSRRINGSWYVSFCQFYFTKSKQYVSTLPTEYTRLYLGKLPTEKIFNVLTTSGQLPKNNYRWLSKQNPFRRFSFWNHTVSMQTVRFLRCCECYMRIKILPVTHHHPNYAPFTDKPRQNFNSHVITVWYQKLKLRNEFCLPVHGK